MYFLAICISSFFFCFLSYESMTTHLQETWKIQNKVTVYSHYMLQLSFKVDKLRFLVGVSISNSQKLIE